MKEQITSASVKVTRSIDNSSFEVTLEYPIHHERYFIVDKEKHNFDLFLDEIVRIEGKPENQRTTEEQAKLDSLFK